MRVKEQAFFEEQRLREAGKCKLKGNFTSMATKLFWLPCLLSSSYILTEASITRAALLFAHVVYGTLPCRIGVCGIVDVCRWVFWMVLLWSLLNMFIFEHFSE